MLKKRDIPNIEWLGEAHKTLERAQKDKYDEYYTQYEDIVSELKYYKEVLKNKVVFCPCDGPESNFIKYFKTEYKDILNALIYWDKFNKKAYYYDFLTETEAEHIIDTDSFLDEKLDHLFKMCDAVVTNPPFSVEPILIKHILKFDKKFLLIGHITLVGQNFYIDLAKKGEIGLGANDTNKNSFTFYIDEEHFKNRYSAVELVKDSKIKVPCKWYTNFEIPERYTTTTTTTTLKMTDEGYWQVSKLIDIPYNWDKPLLVPITFMHKYEKEGLNKKWKIINTISPHIGNKKLFKRILIEPI